MGIEFQRRYGARTAIAVAAALGAAGGYGYARLAAPSAAASPIPPGGWVARIGAEYVDAGAVRREMERRGGTRPGLFQDDAAKRALLDEMLLHRALVEAARRAGVDAEPETRRAIEQLLVTRYLDGSLRRTQGTIAIDDAVVEAHYARHAGEYAMPARRRVAMLRVDVARGADERAWAAAEARAAEAVTRVQALGPDVMDFGPLAPEYSSDATSRHRGGVIGWLSDVRRASYDLDPALAEVAFALSSAGEISRIVRGADAVYVARLVERRDAQARPLDELRAGIEQRLLQERYAEAEAEFRRATLAAADIEVRDAALASIAPPGPPGSTEPQPPPALPGERESSP